MGYQCFADDGNAPVLLVTNLEEGETQAVCPEHLAAFALGTLEAVTGEQWVPLSATRPDAASDEPSDEDDAADGAPQTPEPGPAAPPPGTGSGPDEDEDQADEGDQLAEDAAVRDAELRDELTRSRA